jgi:hypothetical protein
MQGWGVAVLDEEYPSGLGRVPGLLKRAVVRAVDEMDRATRDASLGCQLSRLSDRSVYARLNPDGITGLNDNVVGVEGDHQVTPGI